MKTVALVTQKGGSGKSTLAVHLAVSARRQGAVAAIIDLDPQASARLWAQRRAKDDLAVVAARPAELPRLLVEARQQGATLVLVDTAGHADVSADAAIQSADFVLIPCRPTLYDLGASAATVDMVRRAGGKKAAFVLNGVPPTGSRADEARQALADILPIAPVEIHSRVAYSDALNDGRSVEELEPHGKAAMEIQALYNWLTKV
ncbi:MAG: AAA family ATPase [Acidobacteriaceae bacterium]|nr:AAA family ATPase [Acidobacteriaceae bacterium]